MLSDWGVGQENKKVVRRRRVHGDQHRDGTYLKRQCHRETSYLSIGCWRLIGVETDGSDRRGGGRMDQIEPTDSSFGDGYCLILARRDYFRAEIFEILSLDTETHQVVFL